MDQEEQDETHRQTNEQETVESDFSSSRSNDDEIIDDDNWFDGDTDDQELDDNVDYDDDDTSHQGDEGPFEDDHMPQDSSDDQRGLIGLQNLGNTCYMNGALQALSNCQQLTRFILDCPGFLRDKGLSQSYSELIKDIWNPRSSQYVVPTSIIRNIKCIYPAFRGCTQQDTQEFLRCFLEQLHDELKEHHVRKNGQSSSSASTSSSIAPSKVDSNDGDKNNLSHNSCSNNLNINLDRSIITDTFEFKISSSVVCSSCNNISTTEETFKDLSIPIPSRDHPYYLNRDASRGSQSSDIHPVSSEAMKNHTNNYTNNTNNIQTPSSQPSASRSQVDSNSNDTDEDSESETETCRDLQRSSYLEFTQITRWIREWLSYLGHWFWGPQVTLQDCLSIFFGTDQLDGDNEYSCEICTKKNKGVKYLKILELPEVLCIHFKRYESIGSAKITTHVSFPLAGLDLAPFMSEDSRPQCTTYNLIACICHHGSALLTGHYTTFALNCYDDQWYEFDDQFVTTAQSHHVENSEAYILFYQKSTLDDRTDRQRVKAKKLYRESLYKKGTKKYFVSKQWVNKFNTFVEPGPITNEDFLCEHKKVPKSKQDNVSELCHQVSENVWRYLRKLHGGGPECQKLVVCEICE